MKIAAPAANWGGALRRGNGAFWEAAGQAKAEIDELTEVGLTGMMSPTRAVTEDGSAFDAALAAVEFLRILIEDLRKR